jgi:GntR family transcriptional regulator
MKKPETKSFDLKLNTKSAMPIYEQIKNAVKIAIFSGKLVEGDTIISIRDFATQFKVNPITIMKAYNLLEHEGFLVSKRGSGYYIKVNPDKLQDGKREIFKKEISAFMERIAGMGYTEENFIDELNHYIEQKKNGLHVG